MFVEKTVGAVAQLRQELYVRSGHVENQLDISPLRGEAPSATDCYKHSTTPWLQALLWSAQHSYSSAARCSSPNYKHRVRRG